MNHHPPSRNNIMGIQDFFAWRSQATAPAMDEEVPADVDEPPDHHHHHHRSSSSSQDMAQIPSGFHKSAVQISLDRKESLLTRALANNDSSDKPQALTKDLTRRRSMLSNASIASTAELTSDGGLTSPARTNTPSPPPPSTAYTSFGPYSFSSKPIHEPEPLIAKVDSTTHSTLTSPLLNLSPKAKLPEVVIAAAPAKKRCISFACAPGNVVQPKPVPAAVEPAPAPVLEAPKKRACMIKFACAGPKSAEKEKEKEKESQDLPQQTQSLKPVAESPKRTSRSPAASRKSPRSPQLSRPARDAPVAVRRSSQSPVNARFKNKYIIADENTLKDSEATRFHEFASGEIQEDDWIRRDEENPRARLTINDTLKKENEIRRLGNEAEEEALEDEENEENGEEDEEEDEEDEDNDTEDGDDDEDDGSDDFSDGNETDNEAGFAESDESDVEGEFAFWTPGRALVRNTTDGPSTYRPSAHRTASASSIDSLGHMSPPTHEGKTRPPHRHRPIKIRPGTPDLPDSTDFVCGTLDEDRPLEDAYVSCMEARRNARHKQCPQDIDPSFPTSDLDDQEEDDDDLVNTARSSDENLWLHGKFEDSDGEGHGRRRHKSPEISPRRHHSPPPAKRLRSPPPKQRLHSPPPPKQRLRSPPPRRLFGAHSPRRMHSPPPARHVASPAASPTSHNTTSIAIPFVPLGSRPGLTHTKSLPRTPNLFCRQYRAARLAAANGTDGSDNTDGHVRGAIDIVKGLEQKRQRRKEKFHQKQGKGKTHGERKPQPGKGAERMRELGLFMANKTGRNDPYILSA